MTSEIASRIPAHKRRDFLPSRADFAFSLLFPQTMQHKVAQGGSAFCPAGYLVGTHFLWVMPHSYFM